MEFEREDAEDGVAHDVYHQEYVEQLMEDDEMSAEEAMFMSGYAEAA